LTLKKPDFENTCLSLKHPKMTQNISSEKFSENSFYESSENTLKHLPKNPQNSLKKLLRKLLIILELNELA